LARRCAVVQSPRAKFSSDVGGPAKSFYDKAAPAEMIRACGADDVAGAPLEKKTWMTDRRLRFSERLTQYFFL
jgi:hypothetical protein